MRQICFVFVIAFVAGCRAPDRLSPTGGAEGSYQLTSLGNHELPAVIHSEPGYTAEFTAADITLSADSSFSKVYVVRENRAGVISDHTYRCMGGWQRERHGERIYLHEYDAPGCGDAATATYDGNSTLTLTWDSIGVPGAYVRWETFWR